MSHQNEGQDRLDYRESADITEVHASVLREHEEPRAGTMPIPMWLGVLCAGALTWAAAYVGMFHGGFSGKVYNEYTSSPATMFPLKTQEGAGPAAAELPLVALGEKVFGANCASCHQASGLGNPGQIPPLAGSEWVEGDKFGDKRLVAIIMKGVKGPITVKGNKFNNAMPNVGQALKPRERAAVLTYIRQAWGNKGTGEITEAQVLAGVKDPVIAEQLDQWTEDQLTKIPTGLTLGGGGSTAPATGGTAEAPVASGAFDLAESIKRGATVYSGTCMSCHQPTGQGMAPAFPPLAGSDYATGDPRRVVAITMKGITGALTVNGKPFNGAMPSAVMTFPQLKDDKNLADVLNYVRNNFGNKADVITPEFVGKVRAELASDVAPFTEETLKNFK